MSDSAVAAAEPHQQDQPRPQDATTPARAEAESSENSTALVAQTNSTGTELVDAGGSGSGSGGADKFLPHVERVYRSSETRTPVVLALSDGDPFYTVVQLARREGCAVWSITMGSERNERNALDYVEVGTQNGDWVYLTNVEAASPEVLRNIALTLYTLKPEPKQFPRRHLFRLVLVTAQHVDVTNTIKPVLPQAMLQNALIARAHMPSGVRAEGASPEKIQRRMPVDKPLYEVAVEKHRVRRDAGRDSDSESDAEEPEKKATGMWFHRSVDFYEVDEGSTVSRVNELIFDAVEKEKVDQITELANSGRLNIDQVIRDGMNPLMWAVSRAKVASAKALIAAGADVHVRRESDSCPLLFMCIESEDLITALVEAGANIDERFEGYRLETHPTTMPHIAAMVRDAKGLPQQKTSALDLAATLNNTKLPSDI